MELDDDSFTTAKVDVLDRDELLQLQIVITAQKDEAEVLLRQVRSRRWEDGTYADPRWYNAMDEKVRRKKRQLQHINLRLAALKKAVPKDRPTRQGHHFYEAFYLTAASLLPANVFQEVTVAAQERFISGEPKT